MFGFGRRNKYHYSDTSGLEIKMESDTDFVRRMDKECRDYERERNSQLIAEQLLGQKRKRGFFR